jgi:hypothetical protein
MSAEIGRIPYDTEHCTRPKIMSDFEAGGEDADEQVGIFKADIGLVDCIGIARNNATQFIDIN